MIGTSANYRPIHKALLYIGVLLSAACDRPAEAPALQTGDLLFQCGTGAMTGAISDATGRDGAVNYTHVGIVLHREAADSVLEATTDGGVRIGPLTDFLDRASRIDGQPVVAAMRLRDTTGVTASVARARQQLGAPYDYWFLPDNGRYYCSELVWESYRRPDGTPIFPARPMNFRAADGTLPRYWEELFGRLGEPVPEGVPGTNPNDMAGEAALYEHFRWF